MSRSVRLETRSRARDELRRAMKSIDKVKKWEKKWVPVGSNTCKLKVYKWVPKAAKPESEVEKEKAEEKAKTDQQAKAPAEQPQTKPADKPAKDNFSVPMKEPHIPTNQFLQSVEQATNEDSRDSFTASTAELMKYCPDPDTQDSMTGSEFTVTMSDLPEDSTTKPFSESSTTAPVETTPTSTSPQTNPQITVSDAFKDKEEPTAPTLPEKKSEPETEPAPEQKEEKMEIDEPSAPAVTEEKTEPQKEVPAEQEQKKEDPPSEDTQISKKLKES